MRGEIDGVFFAERARFGTEQGDELVVVERIWRNTAFPRGTDARAFRILLRHCGHQLDGYEGLFLFAAEDWRAAGEELRALAAEAEAGADALFAEHGRVSIDELAAGTRDVLTVDPAFFDDEYEPRRRDRRPSSGSRESETEERREGEPEL